MPFLTHDGLNFYYEEKGTPRGFPFFFQHGLGGDVIQPLSLFNPPDGVRMISFDARAHGETRPMCDPKHLRFSVFDHDLRALMDHLKIPSALVGGISMGAGIALHTAVHHPERVSGLILVRPAWLDHPNSWTMAIFQLVARLIREHGRERGREIFKKMEEYQNLQLESPDNAAALELQFDNPRAVECVARLEEIPKDCPSPNMEDWAKIKVPTLILGCHQDPIHPFEYGKTLAAHIPGAEFKEVTAKSVNVLQYARECQKYIQDFLLFNFLF